MLVPERSLPVQPRGCWSIARCRARCCSGSKTRTPRSSTSGSLGTIELHVFLGSAEALERPAAVLFDLDPMPPAGGPDAARVALLVRERLAARGLEGLVKTTGGLGLHVLVPLNCVHTYAQTRAFARGLAEELAAEHPDVTAHAGRRAQRAGTVLIDWAQNNERRTLVAPYSLRASDVPAVSAPLAWDELERCEHALHFGPREVLERIEGRGNLFAPALGVVQSLR
jgi:bifunctional non-homologous end joining protein LigD